MGVNNGARGVFASVTPTQFFPGVEVFLNATFVDAESKTAAATRLVEIANASLSAETSDSPITLLDEWAETVGDPPPMMAAEFLAPNTVLLLSGMPKAGKTFIVAQMLDDVANGRSLFGNPKWSVEKAGPVVYLCMEGSQHMTKERFNTRGMIGHGLPVYIDHVRRELSTAAGVQKLIERLEPIQPLMVVIDTARQAFGISDWNNASIVQPALQHIVEAVHRNSAMKFPEGCMVLIVHHNNKDREKAGTGSAISGSNALQGIVDGYIVIESSVRSSVTGALEITAVCEARYNMPPRITLQMDTDTLEIKAIDVEQKTAAKQEAQDRKLFDAILKALRLLPGECGSIKQVQNTIRGNHGERTVSDGIKKMVELAILEEAGKVAVNPSGAGAKAMTYREVEDHGRPDDNEEEDENDHDDVTGLSDFMGEG